MEKSKRYKAQPEKLPEPTYWPFFLAFGLVCILWGILTSWLISAMGFVIFSIALSGWIFDIYKEMVKDKEDGM